MVESVGWGWVAEAGWGWAAAGWGWAEAAGLAVGSGMVVREVEGLEAAGLGVADQAREEEGWVGPRSSPVR